MTLKSKKCSEPNCNYPIWARKKCKYHDNIANPKTTTKKSKLKPVSDKLKVQRIEYKTKRDTFIQQNPVCQFPNCTQKATELHHAKGRIGKNLTDESTFRALCHDHHAYIELNPIQAKKLGLSLNRLS